MTATYRNQRNGAEAKIVSSPPATPVQQIIERATTLRTQLEGDSAVATDSVLSALVEMERLATGISASLDEQSAQRDDERFKAERDKLFAIVANIRQSLDLDTIFKTAVTETQQLLKVDRAVIYKFDADYNGVVVAEAVVPGWTISLGMPIIDTCFQKTKASQYATNRIAATDDIYHAGLTPCHIQLLERFQVKANLVVPILQGEKVWGLLIMHQCDRIRHWEESEINLLYQIATQLTVAIQQGESLGIEQQKARIERDKLFSIVSGIRQSLDLDVIFKETVTGVRGLLEADRVVIYKFDPEYNGIVVAESMLPGWTPSLGVPIVDTCFQQTKAGQYITNSIAATDDVYKAGLTPCHIQLLERFQVKANLVVPILQGEKVWGLLIVHQCAHTRHWEESEISLLYQIATQLTVAIQQGELILQAQRQAQVEQDKSQLRERLFQVITEIRRSLDIDTIFQTATRESRYLLQAERVAVYKFDDDWGGEFIAESIAGNWVRLIGTDRARIDDTNLKASQGGRYRNNESSVVNDIYATGFDLCHIEILERFQARAYIIVPIFKEQQLWGLFAAYQNSGPRHWQEFEVDFLYQIATQLTVGLQQSESFLISQLQSQRLAEGARQQKEAKELIQRRAMELLTEVDPVSRGDLTVRARVTDDELGTVADSYNQTIENLSQIVIQVQSAATEVTDVATTNGLSIQALSNDALHQAEEISHALEQIQKVAATTLIVASSARETEQAVQQANETVAQGDAAMNRTVEGILVIRDTVAATAKKIKRLSESSQKISKVVSLISNFAAQTNLLALNASIEAARAGEQGRGFAVVADEVRSLARQSAAATAEIEKLVQEIQTETSEVSAAMEAGTEQVVKGTQLVNETRQSLTAIAAVAGQIKGMVESIALASVNQTEESQTATSIIAGVATMANKTSKDALSTMEAFQKLLDTARALQTSVGQFKVE